MPRAAPVAGARGGLFDIVNLDDNTLAAFIRGTATMARASIGVVGTARERVPLPTLQARPSGLLDGALARLARLARAFGLQQRLGIVGGHRLAEVEALGVFAAELIELDRVRIGLGALGHH